MNGRVTLALVWCLLMPVLADAKTQEIGWASPIQRAAYKYGPYPQVASGGFGAGKTWLYCLKALCLSDTFPKNRGVIARRVSKELRATTMATFFKMCEPQDYAYIDGGRRNDQEGYVRLAGSGSEILFVHFENPETQALLRGLEINWFLIDQAEEAPEVMEEVFDILLGRLMRWDKAEVPDDIQAAEEARTGRPWAYRHPESGRPVPPPYAMLACNPDIEHHWIYRRFHPESPEHREARIPELSTVDGKPTGRMLSYFDLGYRMFHMPSLDNKFLNEVNKQNLLAHDEAFLKRYVRGEWGLPEGAIHVVPNESLIQGTPELLDYFRNACTLYRVLDHGDSSPTACGWFAVDKDDNWFAYREYYLPNALISEHRQNITDLSQHERYSLSLADPSIFHRVQTLGGAPSDSNKERGGRWSVADEYSDTRYVKHNAITWSPADNNEMGTRNRINEALRVDPARTHPITREKGSPRLFFVVESPDYPQGVVHMVRETRSQRRVKIGSDMGRPLFSDQRDDAVPDHGYDLVRYFVGSRPSKPSTSAATPSIKTFEGLARYAAQFKKSQQRVR